MQLQISGQITGLEARNGGWVAVAITEQGNEWPKKVSTKKPDLIQQAQSLMGQVVTALYNEQEGTSINPHTGTPYVNRYLEALSLGESAPMMVQPVQPMPQQPVQIQPTQYIHPQTQTTGANAATFSIAASGSPASQKDIFIIRQSSLTRALETLSAEDRTAHKIIACAEVYVSYVLNGAPAPQPQLQQQAQMVQQAQPQQPVQQQAPPDDDIPF